MMANKTEHFKFDEKSKVLVKEIIDEAVDELMKNVNDIAASKDTASSITVSDWIDEKELKAEEELENGKELQSPERHSISSQMVKQLEKQEVNDNPEKDTDDEEEIITTNESKNQDQERLSENAKENPEEEIEEIQFESYCGGYHPFEGLTKLNISDEKEKDANWFKKFCFPFDLIGCGTDCSDYHLDDYFGQYFFRLGNNGMGAWKIGMVSSDVILSNLTR